MKEDYFGEEVAAGYDDGGPMFSDEVVGPTIDFLAELAGEGRALELGIGTGRVAVPLAQRGVPVHGIDLSEAMVARLREKPGAAEIGATIGDFATTRVEGTFRLAYLVFNTIMNLTTAGRPGRVLPERSRPPGSGRLLRDRGRHARPAARLAR